MKRLFILIFIFSTLSFAYEFKLNSKDLATIKNHPKRTFIETRLKRFDELKIKVKDFELIRKLSHINSFINKIIPKLDNNFYAMDDYWATPKEFLISGHGDCEDYAIAKYFTLLELGIKKENLYLSIVQVKGSKGLHMVLLYSDDKNSSPLVLDNLSFKVIPLNKRADLIPKVAFNEFDSYTLNNNKFLKKVNIDWQGDNKWEKLLNRVYKLNE